jgi:hypothetical protein
VADALKLRWLQISLRVLRFVAYACCLVASVTLAALWVRSLYWNDTIYRHQREGYWHLRSWKGRIEYVSTVWVNATQGPSFGLSSNATDKWQTLIDESGGQGITGPDAFGFGWGKPQRDTTRGVAPLWFFSLVTGAFALALKPKQRWRFGLRELIVVMTIAAVLAGATAALARPTANVDA